MAILVIAIIAIGILFISKMSTALEQPREEEILFVDFSTIYVGGLPDCIGGKKTFFKVKKDRVTLETLEVPPKPIFTITKENLVNAEIMSESQITQGITLGRFLVLGLLSFAFKKEKEVYNNYLVITYAKDNEERKLVLKPSRNLEDTVKFFKGYIGVTS